MEAKESAIILKRYPQVLSKISENPLGNDNDIISNTPPPPHIQGNKVFGGLLEKDTVCP